MKDFRLYELTDFVMDEDFIRWVHLRNSSDTLFWENWLKQNPNKHLLIAEARQIVESIRIEQKMIGAAEIKIEVDNLLKTISHQRPTHSFIHITRKARFIAAAVFVLAIAALYLTLPPGNKKTPKFSYSAAVSSPLFTEKSNSTDTTVSLSLPDGSIIELAARSRISFPNNFGKTATRDVYLSGEAFFKVVKNPARPFRVLTNEIITKVLGTSFTVSSFEKDTTIRVTVRTGKVGVYSQIISNQIASNEKSNAANKSGGIIVTPNQELVYQKSEQKFQKVLIEHPLFIVPDILDKGMAYEDTPVEKVFDQLGRYYGVGVVYDNELLSKCTVTADLTNESFYQKLDLICKAIGAKYEIVDGQVVIQSNGCQ